MTSNFLSGNYFEIANNDCFNYIKTLEDSCLDLIIIDPPYYKVKSEAWDNQWQNVDDYLAWLDDFFYEIWRTLKNNGSFYCFCSPRLSAETEMLIKERFNVLNHIVWSKPTGMHKRQQECIKGNTKKVCVLTFRQVNELYLRSIIIQKDDTKGKLVIQLNVRN